MAKKKDETLMDAAKETVGLGIMSSMGMGVMGAMAPLAPGSGAVIAPVGASLGLLNIGRMAKTGMTLTKTMGTAVTPTKKTSKEKSLLDKIW